MAIALRGAEGSDPWHRLNSRTPERHICFLRARALIRGTRTSGGGRSKKHVFIEVECLPEEADAVLGDHVAAANQQLLPRAGVERGCRPFSFLFRHVRLGIPDGQAILRTLVAGRSTDQPSEPSEWSSQWRRATGLGSHLRCRDRDGRGSDNNRYWMRGAWFVVWLARRRLRYVGLRRRTRLDGRLSWMRCL